MKDESRLIFIPKHSSKLKEFKISRIKLISYATVFLICFTLAGKISLDLLVDFSQNSKIKTLERTNAVLQDRLLEAKTKIDSINKKIKLIVVKDEELRTVLGLSQVSSDVREVGIGGSEFNYNFEDEVSGFEDNIGLGEQLNELAKLEREVKLGLTSYQELMATFNNKQDSLKYLPSLKPVIEGYTSSSFGVRIHPILHQKRMHEGIDISAPRGTPVYATADGLVSFAGTLSGYGRTVKINHKYGFDTQYSHLNKFVVRNGEAVKRGQKIGEVGNSGLSTAPHLHYEVAYKGKVLDPKLYYFDDRILNTMVIQ
jgi:murein DD-endopeptidase MepM/ murein hydrolase activator NlpD